MSAGNSEALPGRFGPVFLQKELETWFGSENDYFRLLPITTQPGRNPIYSKNHSAAYNNPKLISTSILVTDGMVHTKH